ncbi:MAG: cyclic nucleotide-binding domain-containing protein, partial [Xanthobacteraceae bacterium]
PVWAYEAGATVLAEGTRTGRLLILKQGAVCVVAAGVEIARVAEPGAVFGELSALLDQPHGADVRTLEACEFYAADAAVLLTQQPVVLLYVATLLARRLDLANRGLVELKGELAAGASPGVVRSALGKVEGLLSSIGAGYIRAGAGPSINLFA